MTNSVDKHNARMPARLTPHERRLGRELIRAGVVSREQMSAAAEERDARPDVSLRRILVEGGYVSKAALIDYFAERYRLDRAERLPAPPSDAALALMTARTCSRD